MARIIENDNTDNTNVDGLSFNNFCSGGKSGIIKGKLNECAITSPSSSVLTIDSGELLIFGSRIILDSTNYTFSTFPTISTRYSYVAEIVISDSSVITFSMFIQLASASLTTDDLYATSTAAGTYQIELATFTLTSAGITDLVRTVDVITGGGSSSSSDTYIRIGTVTTTMVSSGIDADVDIENVIDSETGLVKTNFNFTIPNTAGTSVTVAGEEVASFNADTKADKTNVLEKDNTTAYTPTADYHPSTKKYIDDVAATNATNISTNATNISTNATNISTNAINISTNATDIDNLEALRVTTMPTASADNVGKTIQYLGDTISSNISIFEISPNISGVTIIKETFEKKYDLSGDYRFIYSIGDTTWKIETIPVILADYGISVYGTPVNGDILQVKYNQKYISSQFYKCMLTYNYYHWVGTVTNLVAENSDNDELQTTPKGVADYAQSKNLIVDYTVPSDTSSVTISDLDMNADGGGL